MRIIIILFLISISRLSFAQLYTMAEKEIEAPSHVYNSFVSEMKNGTTVLLQMEPRIEGFLLKIYDEHHEEKINSKLMIDGLKDINNFYAHSFIELNQKAVLFYIIRQKGIISFQKTVIDPASGEHKTETLGSFKETTEVLYFNENNCFLKIVEDQAHSKYSIISGFTENNQQYTININTYKTSNDQLISKKSQQIDNYYTIDLLDAMMDNDDIYLCLHKKFKPKASETQGWFVLTQVSYIPKSQTSLMKVNINNNLKEIVNIDLPDIIYSVKVQLTKDPKNNQLNMLLSAINSADDYGKIPDSKTVFYKFSTEDLMVKLRKEMINAFAINRAMELYPGMEINKNAFANFPQCMYTDSTGNNKFIFQTVYNHYNHPDSYSDRIQKELAVISTDAEAKEDAVSFSPYFMSRGGGMSGQLESFAFECNDRTTCFKRPRPHETYENWITTFEVNHKSVFIYNLLPKNVDKNITDKFVMNRGGDVVVIPMIAVIDKNYYEKEKVFKDPKYSKIKFNMYTSSFNEASKTFVVFATELGGSKERLVWLKFN